MIDGEFVFTGCLGSLTHGYSLSAGLRSGMLALWARGEGTNLPLEGLVSGMGLGPEIVMGSFAVFSGRPDRCPWRLLVKSATTTKQLHDYKRPFCIPKRFEKDNKYQYVWHAEEICPRQRMKVGSFVTKSYLASYTQTTRPLGLKSSTSSLKIIHMR